MSRNTAVRKSVVRVPGYVDMGTVMDIGVIIVNWNGGRYLRPCVESVLAQTRYPDSIILVDNGSTDESLLSIHDYEAHIQVVSLGRNTGFAFANNVAVGLMETCDWIVLLNPDAVADPGWLEAIEAAVHRYPDAHAFACQMLSMSDRQRLDGAGDCFHLLGFGWRRFHGLPIGQEEHFEKKVFGACGGAAAYRRSSFIEADGFDEDYFCYCEDLDLAFRMLLLGYRTWYIPTAVVRHVGGGTQDGDSKVANFYGHRNLVWTWYKSMPLALLLPLIPVHFCVHWVAAFYKGWADRSMTVPRAKWSAFRDLGTVLAKRRQIQRRRRVTATEVWTMLTKTPTRQIRSKYRSKI